MKTCRFWVRETGSLMMDGELREAKCLAGSNVSEEDARRNAKARLVQVQKKIDGTTELSDDYEMEIREEVVREINPDAVITRNRYGALVLNVARMLIMDVDEPPKDSLFEMFSFKKKAAPKERIIGRIEKLCQDQYPEMTLRMYETPKGIRCMVLDREYHPGDSATQALMSAFGNDPLYQMMCRKQDCFRARLTPKPHRVKFHRPPHKFPRFAVTEEEDFKAWLGEYERLSASHAACRFIKQIHSVSRFRELVEVHDSMAGATSGRKLA